MTDYRDRMVFEDALNVHSNARDRAEIDALTQRQGYLYAEFLRLTDELQVDPKPIPHVHTPHEDVARRSFWAAILATVGGMVIAVLLTSGSVSRPFVGACGAILLFAIAEALLDLGLFALPRTVFSANFYKIYMPSLIVFLLSMSALLVGRFASPAVAEVLLTINAYLWWGLECSLLLLGALSVAAWTRFGWSGSLFKEYIACSHRINELKLVIERRISDAKVMAAPMLLLLVFGAAFQPVLAQTIMIDRTGSIDQQKDIERSLVAALTNSDSALPPLNLVLFTEHVFQAPIVRIQPPSPRLENVFFQPLVAAARSRSAAAIRFQLESALRAELPIAKCTSVPDIMARAMLEDGPVLIITDGVHDCRTGTGRPRPSSSVNNIIVLLVRSKTDRGSDASVFGLRRQQILRYVPRADVLPEFRLPFAVRFFLVKSRGHTSQSLVTQN